MAKIQIKVYKDDGTKAIHYEQDMPQQKALDLIGSVVEGSSDIPPGVDPVMRMIGGWCDQTS